jgi:hypothetical protein
MIKRPNQCKLLVVLRGNFSLLLIELESRRKEGQGRVCKWDRKSWMQWLYWYLFCCVFQLKFLGILKWFFWREIFKYLPLDIWTKIRLIFTLNSCDWLQLRKHQKNPLTIILSPWSVQRLITNDSINFHSHVGDEKFHLDFTEKIYAKIFS